MAKPPPGLLSVGPHFVFSVLIGGFFGYKMDGWFETKPILMLVMGALGFAAGVINMMRELEKWNRSSKSENEKRSDDEPKT